MSNQLMELEQQLENQLIIVKEMKGMKQEMTDMRDDVKRDIKELRDNIKLTRSECREIQSAVQTKCNELTSDLFGRKVSDDLFLAKTGHFRIAVYNRLKDIFNVTTYYEIRRIDFTDAKRVIRNVSLDNLQGYQKRLTTRQKEIAVMNNDPVKHLMDDFK